ncbi:MAG: hypothetical protein O8C61_00675 [Candidatus Methanoperedens sp.]|nr:hypothetical protein [Candidatus Methanoperedens sp.]
MSKKIIILSIFITASIFMSGCIFDKNNGTTGNETKTNISDIIPTTNLPSGITFLAINKDANVDINNNITVKAIEGIYRSNTDDEDVLIDVINTETPEALFNEYKLQYKDANYNPFNETSINGHKATWVKYYITKNGNQIPKFLIVWTTKNSMIKVGGSVDPQKVIDLAAATKS